MKKNIFSILAIFCCVVIVSSVTAIAADSGSETVLKPDFSQMDGYIQDMMKDCRIPGFSVAVVSDEDVLYMKGYGSADDTGRTVTPQTPFLVGSVSKTFTALAVMQLVEAGKVKLDQPVQIYLPEFTLADANASSKITVRELLNHTSGIAENAEFSVATLRGDDETIDELVGNFSSIKLKTSPGSKFEYGNANFIILGALIQKVSGISYEDYIQRYIFDPLEMHHSYTSALKAEADGLALGYRPILGFPQISGMPYRKDFLPAYSVISCAEDMTHYMIAMMHGGKYKDASILSEQRIKEMTSSSAEISSWMSYGLGWYVTSGSIYHGGDLPDYQAKVKLLPEDGIGVVLMYNTSSNTLSTLFNVGYRDKIESGIINTLYGVSPTEQPGQSPLNLNSYPVSVSYGLMLGLIVLIALLLIFSGIRLWSLPRRLSKSRKAFWRIVLLSALINAALPLTLFIAIPRLTGVAWPVVLYYIPDGGWTVVISSVLLLLLGTAKGIIIFSELRRRKPD